MADFNVSDVASKVNVPQQISLGDMINIARGAQAYKQAKEINPLAVREQQAATELAEGTVKPKIEQQGYQTELAGTQSKKAKFNLTNEMSQVISDEANATINDPRIKNAEDTPEGKKAALEAIVSSKKRAINRGVDEHLAEAIYAPYISKAITNPSAIYQEGVNSIRAGAGVTGQANLNAPSVQTINGVPQLVTTGTGEVQPLNMRAPISTPVTDVTGRTSIQQRDAQGNIIGVAPYPTGPANQPASQQEFFNIPVGETKESLNEVQGIRKAANTAAGAVPGLHDNNREVIRLAKSTSTGGGADILRNLGGGYALLPWTTDDATNFDKLGHYIANNNIALSQQAGLGTDQGRELASQTSGSKKFTRDAVISIAKTNDALASGADLYNRGIENNIKRTGNLFAARDFKNQWAQTVDVNALRLYNAINNNDKDEIRDVVKNVGGIKSEQYKTLLKRIDKMNHLIQGQ